MSEAFDLTEEQIDPFEECLDLILSFYGLKIDMKGQRAQLPGASGALAFDGLSKIALRLGLTMRKCPAASIEDLRLRNAPAILLAEDGAPIVYLPPGNYPEKFYKAGEGFLENFNALFSEKKGPAYIFSRQNLASSLDIRHLRKKHALDWFWEPILTYWPQYGEILLSSFFINLLVLALPLYTMNIYDRVAVNFAEATLTVLTVGIFIALLFDYFFKIARVYILEKVAARTAVEFDGLLMERFLSTRPNEIDISAGEKANIFRELQNIKEFYTARLMPTLVDLPFFVLFSIVIYVISPPLVLVPVVGAIIILAANFLSRLPVSYSTENYFKSMQSKSSFLIETLMGLETFRTFNAIGHRLFGWNEVSAAATESARRNHLTISIVSNFSVFIMQLVQVFVIFFGVYEISSGRLTTGGLIAVTIISGRAVGPVVGLAGVMATLRQARDVLLVIDKIFTLPDGSQYGKSSHGPFKGKIEIQNITFLYPKQDRPALRNLSLLITPGEKVGLIGKTGAGKSTLGRLIAGHIEPQEGSIFLDGFSLKSLNSAERCNAIGFVPQNPYLFRGSIRENIFMGNFFYSKAALDNAIHHSGLDLVIEQSGQGLDMDIGENGERLSGGQRQAISLARAIIKNPEILILDEPTTGMDTSLEDRLRNSLRARPKTN